MAVFLISELPPLPILSWTLLTIRSRYVFVGFDIDWVEGGEILYG